MKDKDMDVYDIAGHGRMHLQAQYQGISISSTGA